MQTRYDYQHFFFDDSIISILCVCQSPTGIRYRSVVLEKCSAKSKVACITLNDELFRRVEVRQSRCFCEKLFQRGVSFLLCSTPVPVDNSLREQSNGTEDMSEFRYEPCRACNCSSQSLHGFLSTGMPISSTPQS